MPVRERPRYQGSQRKLVIAFDVGTTFSGASYSILDPGEVPKVFGVTRYPAQENVGSDSKIPTIIYYDKNGMVRAAGAEALQENIIEQAEDEEWTKVEWFKLHLRPRTLSATHISDDVLPPLPRGKTAVEVFGDFLKYLFRCARDYIQESHANGEAVWRSFEGQMDFVLSHPNGWEGAQQSQMRRAAVVAGLIRDTAEGHSHIQFVTEGEASLHFCVGSNLSADAITNGQGVIVVDAGGGTVDLSAYYMKQSPNTFEEIAPPECRLQGSIFVSRRAQKYLEDKLRGSRFGSPEDIATMTAVFDKATKTKFRDSNETSYIKFGSARDNDPRLGIRSGQLKLPG
jgi:molecular chaperone DnaK (HSP70)